MCDAMRCDAGVDSGDMNQHGEVVEGREGGRGDGEGEEEGRVGDATTTEFMLSEVCLPLSWEERSGSVLTVAVAAAAAVVVESE